MKTPTKQPKSFRVLLLPLSKQHTLSKRKMLPSCYLKNGGGTKKCSLKSSVKVVNFKLIFKEN